MKVVTERVGKAVATAKIERLKPSTLTTDERVQRPLDQARVAKIVTNFDPDALGVMVASRREDGTIITLDGQHRTAALVQLRRGDEHWSYKVFDGLTLPQEAHLFRLLNDFKRPTPVNLFRSGVTEGDPKIVACDQLLTTAGFTSKPSHVNSFRAVNALVRLYEIDPTAVKRTLMVLTGAWGATRDSGDGRLFTGLGAMVFRYAEIIDVDKLTNKLAKEPGGPAALIGAARGLSSMRRISIADAVADIATNVYNRQLRTGVLPGWRTS